jgi:hypothetical protein
LYILYSRGVRTLRIKVEIITISWQKKVFNRQSFDYSTVNPPALKIKSHRIDFTTVND